jgi:hypothetical protein
MWERLGVMDCNNVETSSARQRIVLCLPPAGDSMTWGGSSLSKLSHHFSPPPPPLTSHVTKHEVLLVRFFKGAASIGRYIVRLVLRIYNEGKECRSRVVINRALYSVGLRFDSRPESGHYG